jgi:ATP-dependent Lhr-like helicase
MKSDSEVGTPAILPSVKWGNGSVCQKPISLVLDWFEGHGWKPFDFQVQAWNAYLAGESGLIHASTGTGKTYATWMGPLLEWMGEKLQEEEWPNEPPPLRVLWITPLRALATDITEALSLPVKELGLPWTVEIRTGDTSATIRKRQRERLPSALVTTPESMSLLLTWGESAGLFQDLRLVVVDEWHELLGSKRGVQTELALARLRNLRPGLQVWGLSATLGNLQTAIAALIATGNGNQGWNGKVGGKTAGRGRLLQGSIHKSIKIDSILPTNIERFPWGGHIGLTLLPQVVDVIEEAQSTLLFTNTRSQAERWYQAILEARPDWAGVIALHHGSLDRHIRNWVEENLRLGRLRCVVCTSSLDLGIDFTPVDRVVQVGSPKGVARLLQRAGRSGHQPGAVSRVTCVPTNGFELVEIAAARDAAEKTRIEGRMPFDKPLDVLVQHLVTVALSEGFKAEELLSEVRSTYAYRHLTESEWDWALDFVTRGGKALEGYSEYKRLVCKNGLYVIANDSVARRHRLSIGTITNDAAVTVQYIKGGKLGTVEESFISRLRPGDRFIYGGKTLELVRFREMTAFVRKAKDPATAVPRWHGGRMPLSTELAKSVRGLLEKARLGLFYEVELEAARPILELQTTCSKIPATDELLIERFKTREGHHLFFYPFEGRMVHEGLAALSAYRISRIKPISFSIVANDYGFGLLSADIPPLRQALDEGLLLPLELLKDIVGSLNAAELAKRHFREIARVAGLVFQGYPGRGKSMRQVQASSALFYEVFSRYDPENLLLHQARREVLERQLEKSRLGQTLERLSRARLSIVEPKHPTPFSFPLLVERVRERLSSEKLADRVRKMQVSLEETAAKDSLQKGKKTKKRS